MSTILLLIGVSAIIGVFSYVTNAGLGDRKPKERQDSDDSAPPPSR
jgi:hypothetical protein